MKNNFFLILLVVFGLLNDKNAYSDLLELIPTETVPEYLAEISFTIVNALDTSEEADPENFLDHDLTGIDFCGEKTILYADNLSSFYIDQGPQVSILTKCLRFSDIIPSGTEKNFGISKENFKMIRQFGNRGISFRFRDNQQYFPEQSSHCFGLERILLTDLNSIRIVVDQRFRASYGCTPRDKNNNFFCKKACTTKTKSNLEKLRIKQEL